MHRYLTLGRRRLLDAATRLRLRLNPSPRALDRDRALDGLSAGDRVLFLCLGNVCRSPMAERYARRRLRDRGVDGATVDSAGFVDEAGRHSPEVAREAAREFGVDLSAHRSRVVDAGTVAAADAVFVMDVRNYRDVRRRFDGATDRTYFLGAVGPGTGTGTGTGTGSGTGDGDGDGFELADPNGGDRETFRRVYADITDAVDRVVAALARVDGADGDPPGSGIGGD